MHCTRCHRRLKHGGYNGTQYGPTCYALLFGTVRKAKSDKAEEHDGQADMFGLSVYDSAPDSARMAQTKQE